MKRLLFLILFLPTITSAQTAEDYYRMGNQERDSTKYDEALTYYDRSISLDKLHSISSYWGKQSVHMRIGDKKAEIEDLDAIIKINPSNEAALDMRGFSKYILKDYNGAIEDYTTLITHEPHGKYILVWINWRAKAKLAMGIIKERFRIILRRWRWTMKGQKLN